MNLDFHYYGTYVAARLAGYDKDPAQTIAHAAQYVDDSNESMLKDSLGHYYISDFSPIPTVQSMWDMAKKDIFWSEEALNKIADIWVPFHFLPGNYGKNTNIKQYTGPQTDSGSLYRWTFDDESTKQFKMLCQPNNLIVKTMINDIILNHKNNDYTLHLAGMRMHVLADTWAHMFYIGMPAWFINDALEDVFIVNGTAKTPYKWLRVWPWDDSTDIIHGDTATPNMLAYNSVVYLGHGRMGHLPDYPWYKYEYTPRWSKNPITKDNTSYFLQAFKQLTKALECIKNNTIFDINSYADLPAETENVIKKILSTTPKDNDQSETWRNNIGKIKINGTPLEVPVVYNKDLWLDKVKEKMSVKDTDYYHFNKSACLHLKLVQDSLAANNINFDSTPREDIVSTRFKCKKGKYIGPIDESYKSIQYYPQMQDRGITLQIIKQTPRLLTSGDIIEIKTLESTTGKYNFLGAWETTSLYYYLRAYDLSKQKWQIEKVDSGGSKAINAGDRVRFKNMHFDQEPYMCTYDYWMGGTYLTTQANGSSDNAIWIMDGLTEFDINIVTDDYFRSDIIDLDTSTRIHDDIKIYGIIDSNNNVDINNLRTALDNIGLGFIHVALTDDQKEQVYIQLQKIVN
ncbi:MAG: hypothetical protein FIB08_04515 [Candidatus Methanoperedens sp.]|nr:hypothetical protein [Candidatus Methanoperedens sp.]